MPTKPEIYTHEAPQKGVLSASFNGGKQNVSHPWHPWRYFIADGESLAKIQALIHDAEHIDEIFADFAQTHGADEFDGYHFIFKNAPVVPFTETGLSQRYRLRSHPEFTTRADRLGQFDPDPYTPKGRAFKERLLEIERLSLTNSRPQLEHVEELKAALAREAGAKALIVERNSDGQSFTSYFEFENREDELEPVMPQKLLRHAQHSIFIRENSDYEDHFTPNENTNGGFRLAEEARELSTYRYPEMRLAQWLDCHDLNTDPGGHPRFREEPGRPADRRSAQLEKIGDEWIIKVPVVGEGIYGADGKGGALSGYQESWAIPPGAHPINISEYFGRLEKEGLIKGIHNIGLPDAPAP